MSHKPLRLISLIALLGLKLFADAHIFVYHRFDDSRYPKTNTSLKELEKEFQYLKEHHYQVISLSSLIDALQKREDIKDNWVVLTIDDGYRSFLKALPLFRKYHYPFTLFVATKPIEKRYPDFLTWDDLKKIKLYGTIGLHSHAHPHLIELCNKKIKKDTQKGLHLLKIRLGIEPKIYAYPYGEYNKRVKDMMKNLGFKALFNQNLGAINNNSFQYNLDRIALVAKANIKRALQFKRLEVKWIEPRIYPKDNILKKIVAYINSTYKQASLYVSGYGWKRVKVKDGKIEEILNYKLFKRRIRVILKVKNSKINTKLFVRSSYGVK